MIAKRLFVISGLLLLTLRLFPQISQQTGSAVFSLPVFNWKDDKSRLYANIALSYNSGNGLKVTDIASNLGQGWNLVAGGVITRMQMAEPDDQKTYGNAAESDRTKFPAGFMYATTPASDGCPDALTKYPLYKSRNQIYAQHNYVTEDRQADYFSFQFNSKAGMFILNRNGIGESLGDSKIKIYYQTDENMRGQGKRTTITSFQIHDVDGLIYKFTLHGLTKVLRTEYCDQTLNNEQKQPKEFKGGRVYYQKGFDKGPTGGSWINTELAYPWIINSWYLTEIEDALTHTKINLTYEIRDITQHAGADIIHDASENYSTIITKVSVTKTPELKSITTPDGHSVILNYGSDRVDMSGQKALSSIDVKYEARFLSRHELNTTYFILNRYGTPVTPYQKSVARLCLKSVRKIGVDLKEDTPPYIFDYYAGSNSSDDFVPPPFFYAKDPWGFYNGNESKAFNGTTAIPLNASVTSLTNDQLRGLCFLRNSQTGIILNPKSGYAKNGLLKQIIYPTGGTLSYEYEQNYGKIDGTERMVGGVHVSKTLSTDGGYSNGCADPITTQYKYTESGSTASSLWGLEMPATSIEYSSYYNPEKRKYKLPASCDYKFKFPGILSQNQSISLSDWQNFMQVFSVVADVASVISLVADVVTYICAGTGLVGIVVAVIMMAITALITCTNDRSDARTNKIYYNFDLAGFGSLPAQFHRIEVTESSGTTGKTVTEFTSSNDYAIWFPTNPSLAPRQRYGSWAYGLPKSITVYDAGGYIVKQTLNKYNWTYARTNIYCQPFDDTFIDMNMGKARGDNNVDLFAQVFCVSVKCFVKKASSQRIDNWNNTSSPVYHSSTNNDILVDFYNFYTGRVLLDTTFERVFKPNSSQYLETITAYSYRGDYNYEPHLIRTIQSNGDRIDKSIKYQSDYSGAIINDLVNANLIATPVATSLYIAKASGVSGYISETVSEFTKLGNGDIKPLRILEQRFDKPSTLTLYAGPGSSVSSYKIIQSFFYDNMYYVSGLKDEGNRMVCNIYDYNNKYVVEYVVASVVNADPVTDNPAYTSFETSNFGKWALGGAPVYSASSVTGSRSFTLSTGKSLSATLNTAKPYTVSFWSTTATVTVTGGATLIKSAPLVNGFTYYEYDITQGTTTVTIAGSGTIDELRLYPRTARMNTVTYDPLIGKTSECDENNRITYYDYDNLGRLATIKDEKKNILKAYEYNSISKQTGCPATFYSKAVSETFARNNCAANYQGAAVAFTVAANAYSSTISQEDADRKAELAILTNGQAYANANGACQQIFYNTAQSQTVTSESCAAGYKGGSYTYTVPANRYSSLVSVADANDKALMDIDANAYAYANANPVCVIDTDADWVEVENNAYCLTVNGALPAHRFILFKDENPNSATYNQTQWIDIGNSDECPDNVYYNAQRNQAFTRNNCPAGQTGSSVTYTVAPGKYSSAVSQAAADQLAQNEINANGQSYANANGTCSITPVAVTVKNNGSSGVIAGAAQFINSSNQTFSGSFGGPGNISTVNLVPGVYTLQIALSPGSSSVLIDINGTQQVVVSTSGSPVTIGTVNISSGFYIYGYATYFSNTAQSGTFTRNNCPAGQVGSNVVYTVAANTHYSGISQADANAKAMAVVNANGQNYANTNGTCVPSTPTNCTFTWASGINSVGASSVVANGYTVNFILRFMSPTNNYSGGLICTIDGTCRPPSTRTVNVTDGSNVWAVSVTSGGATNISLVSGTAPSSSALITLSGSYTK